MMITSMMVPNISMVIFNNFCFDNFLVSCEEVGQDSRGPYSLSGVVEDRRG